MSTTVAALGADEVGSHQTVHAGAPKRCFLTQLRESSFYRSRIVNTWGFDMDDVKAVIEQATDAAMGTPPEAPTEAPKSEMGSPPEAPAETPKPEMGTPPEAPAEAPKPEVKKVRRAAKKVGPKNKVGKKAKKSPKKSPKKAPKKAKAKKKKAKKAKH
jgi:outer membrane biosynthesis protein TonB